MQRATLLGHGAPSGVTTASPKSYGSIACALREHQIESSNFIVSESDTMKIRFRFVGGVSGQRRGVRSHCAATKVLVILSSDRCDNIALLRNRRARRPDMRDGV